MQINITGFSEGEVLNLIMLGLHSRKADIEGKILSVQSQIAGNQVLQRGPRPAVAKAPVKAASGKRGPMTPEAKAKIVEAQKKRWAKFHKDKRTAERLAAGLPPRTRKKSSPPPAPETQVAEAVQ